MLDNISFCSHVEELMRKHHVPGLSIAIINNDQVSSTGYGSASFKPAIPCTPETLFDVASCAKSMTAASIALLVEDNEKYPDIQYDAIMSTLLPEDFVMSDPGFTESVTVEDLLSHRTGMAPHDNSYFGHRAQDTDNARSITRNLRNLAVAAPLRSRYLYCNMMYTVLTHLVEVKSKQSFSDFLEGRFFTPLGMTSSNLQPANARAKGLGDRIATGYIWNKTTGYHECHSADCPEGQGAGSIITSANDFIKWVKALMIQEGPITSKVYHGLVKLRSFPSHHPARLKPLTSPPFYAAGMEIYYYRGHAVVGHNGVIPGFGSRFAFIPDFKFGAVIMGNSSEAGSVANVLIRELIDDVLGISEVGRSIGSKNRRETANPVRKMKQKEKQQLKSTQNSNANRAVKGTSYPNPDDQAEPQAKPLVEYTGQYWNAGYRVMKVEIKDNRLFVDASDRSMGFTLTFHHLSSQTKYIAYLADEVDGGNDPIDAEFVFKNNQVVRMGLRLENSLKGLIWFQRMNDMTHHPTPEE